MFTTKATPLIQELKDEIALTLASKLAGQISKKSGGSFTAIGPTLTLGYIF